MKMLTKKGTEKQTTGGVYQDDAAIRAAVSTLSSVSRVKAEDIVKKITGDIRNEVGPVTRLFARVTSVTSMRVMATVQADNAVRITAVFKWRGMYPA